MNYKFRILASFGRWFAWFIFVIAVCLAPWRSPPTRVGSSPFMPEMPDEIYFSDPKEFIVTEFGENSDWMIEEVPDLPGPYVWRRLVEGGRLLSGEQSIRFGVNRNSEIRQFGFYSTEQYDLIVFPVESRSREMAFLAIKRKVKLDQP